MTFQRVKLFFNRIYIDELVVFDMFYIAGYVLLITYFYALAYKERYDFYAHRSQMESEKGYGQLLANLPNGIVLLDNANNPVFCNQAIKKVVKRKLGQLSFSSIPQSDSAINKPEVSMTKQSAFKEVLS